MRSGETNKSVILDPPMAWILCNIHGFMNNSMFDVGSLTNWLRYWVFFLYVGWTLLLPLFIYKRDTNIGKHIYVPFGKNMHPKSKWISDTFFHMRYSHTKCNVCLLKKEKMFCCIIQTFTIHGDMQQHISFPSMVCL